MGPPSGLPMSMIGIPPVSMAPSGFMGMDLHQRPPPRQSPLEEGKQCTLEYD